MFGVSAPDAPRLRAADGGTGFDELRGGEGNDVLVLSNSELGGNAFGGAGDDVLLGSDALSSLSSLEGDSRTSSGTSRTAWK